MKNFLKSIVVGAGGIAPGFSGSVLLVLFGLYEKTVEAIATIFKNFKKNLLFLIPIFAGFGAGIFLFSKVMDYLLTNFEMYTRFAALGLVAGTLPLFYKEVKKKGFKRKYYIHILIAFLVGFSLFVFNSNLFPVIADPNFSQSIILGFVLAASAVIPGISGAVVLSAIGLYETFVNSVANMTFSILIPAGIGAVTGALILALSMNILLKKYYTVTFAIIFGLFLAIIPNVLNESCYLGFNLESYISIGLVVVGFLITFFLGGLKKTKATVKNK